MNDKAQPIPQPVMVSISTMQPKTPPSKHQERMLYASRECLARVLASEDIRVNHSKQARTAHFDPVKRILTLPMWENMVADDYIAIVAHEVAHALWTPKNYMQDLKAVLVRNGRDPKNEKEMARLHFCFNVVEDMRVERMIKSRYQGLLRSFWAYRGGTFMRILSEAEQKKIARGSGFTVAERINKHFKIGAFLPAMEFDETEIALCRRIAAATGYPEVLRLAEELWLLDEEERNEGQQEEGEEEDEMFDPDGAVATEFASKSNNTHVYIDVPDYGGVVPYERIEGCVSASMLQNFDPFYGQFLNSNRDQIQLLWSEFHRRAAASTLARERTSDSGMVDPTKLWSYKTTDDIFLSHTEVFRGVDHGIVMFIDWSGSMNSILHQTMVECMCLVEFLRRSQIPATVYAFTDSWGNNGPQIWRKNGSQDLTKFNLLTLIDTRAQEREYRRMASFALGLTHRISLGSQSIPRNLTLGGTPLNGTVCAAMDIMPRFRRETGAKVVHGIFLTDGEATDWFGQGDLSEKNMPSEGEAIERPIVHLRRKGFTRTAMTEDRTEGALDLLRDVVPQSRIINLYLDSSLQSEHSMMANHRGFDVQFNLRPKGKRSVRLISLITEMIAAKKEVTSPWG